MAYVMKLYGHNAGDEGRLPEDAQHHTSDGRAWLP